MRRQKEAESLMSQGLDSCLGLSALWLVTLGVYLTYNAGV